MNTLISKQIHRANYLNAELESLYHQATLNLGVADSSMRVLYTICDNGDSCMLSDICKQSGISKQTVNSALRKLESEKIIYLKQQAGRTKMVCLTKKGNEYAEQTVNRLFILEHNAFKSWTLSEINMYLELLAKYVEDFRQQLNLLRG